MSDKQLTESAWRAFVKAEGGKDGYKDGALLKALAALDKAERSGPQAQLEALDDIDKQAEALRKLHKADKALGSRLDDVGKAVARERKSAEAAMNRAGDDEEEESPALLTSKLVPLLRQVRKGDVVMQVLIATTGKETAVLLSRKGIAPTRIKLLKEYLGVSGAVKSIKGECLLEANAHTFVLQSQAAGMAKKLKAALFAQTDLRLKVRVRGEDPNDLDEDGEDGEDGGADAASAAGRPSATADDAAAASPAAPPAPPPPATTYEARLAALLPRVDAALTRPGPQAAKVQALLDFARGKAGAGDHLAALQGLVSLDKLLATLAAAPADGAAAPHDDDPSAAFNARLAALLPRLKPVAAANPKVGEAARLKVSEAGVLARQKEFTRANALLGEVDELLLTSSPSQAGDAAPVEAGKAFTARLAAMQKSIQAALAGALAAELKPLVAALAAAGHDAGAGGRALDAIEALLTRGSAAPAGGGTGEGTDDAAPPPPGEQAATYAQRLAALEDRYTSVLAGNPADATRLRAQMAYAAEQAELGEHGAALAGLQRLEQLLDDAGQPPGGGNRETGYEGLVAYRRTLVEFGQAVASVESQIAGFKAAIPGQLPGETELADELIEALDDYNQDLKDAVDEAMNAAENEASPVTAALLDRLNAYRLDVASNPLIRHVDNNPFGVSATVRQTLTDALTHILDAMPAAR